jgi:uncharacterized protein (DUF4415 family)
MTEGKDIKSRTPAALRTGKARGEDRTDLRTVDATPHADLARLSGEDPDERDFEPDENRAPPARPEVRRSVHLRLEQDVIDFFKAQGRGHISRMQAALRAYVEAYRSRDGG